MIEGRAAELSRTETTGRLFVWPAGAVTMIDRNDEFALSAMAKPFIV